MEPRTIPWRRLTVEAGAIVASILLAFAIDAWWDGLKESRVEVESLELIRRDLASSMDQLRGFSEYVSVASQSALRAYSALTAPGPYDHQAIRTDLIRVDRMTLRLPRAAYTDLLSTGSLRIIGDRELRDSIVRFYEFVELIERIIQKNNDLILDRQLNGRFFEEGLLLPHIEEDSGTQILNEAYARLDERLGADFVHPEDPLWSFEPDSPEWRRLRSVLLNAALAHTIGEMQAAELVARAAALDQDIAAWLAHH